MSNKKLTERDIEEAAAVLGCEPAAILAVCEVEAPRGGFLPDGRPVILFERHKFHRFTRGKFSAEIPDLSHSRPGGYLGGVREWERYERAARFDERAAMMSCSWGRFQIMGFNYAHAGFDSVEAFVQAMSESEGEQLKAFIELIESFGLADELIRHDWSGFAFGYNGPKYKEKRYDAKLRAAFDRYSGGPARSVSASPRPVEGTQAASPAEVPEYRSPVKAGRGAGPVDPPVKASRDETKAWLTHLASWATGAGTGAFALFEKNEKLLYIAGAIIIVGVLGWFVRSIVLDYARLKTQSDPDRYNVT